MVNVRIIISPLVPTICKQGAPCGGAMRAEYSTTEPFQSTDPLEAVAPDTQKNGVNFGNFGQHLAPGITKQMNTTESYAGWCLPPIRKNCAEKAEVSQLNFGGGQPVRQSLPSILLNSFWRT